MSLLGQNQKYRRFHVMSALAPVTDINNRLWHGVRASLFDHLAGACQQRLRNAEAERFRSLEIYHQFVLGRCLHWQVGRLFALQYAVGITSCASELVEEIRPI